MIQKLISLEGINKLNLTMVSGDLQIIGWERSELVTKCDEEELSVSSHGDEIDLSCEDDLVVYVKSTLDINVLVAEGDTDVRAIDGDLRLRQLAGDLQLRNVGNLLIDDVDGDLTIKGCHGSVKILRVAGDVTIKDVSGDLHVDAEGDLTIRGFESNLWARTSGDAALYLKPLPSSAVYVEAEGDILAHLPARIDATLKLSANDDGDIRVDMPGIRPVEDGNTRELILGAGTCPIQLTAEGEVIVTSRDDPSGFGDYAGGSAGVPADLDERINRITEEATRRAMEATGMAGNLSEMIQSRVERAMRKVEDKMNSADRRAHHTGIKVGQRGDAYPRGSAPQRPAQPAGDPVSDDERLAILKMLQEKKITIEQAETLLSSLEGK